MIKTKHSNNTSFQVGATYSNRSGRKYVYLRKNVNVTIFKDVISEKLVCRNSNGLYRWDQKETDLDICLQ